MPTFSAEGTMPEQIFYWLAVTCQKCDWEGMTIGVHPKPEHRPLPFCGNCGAHALVDREPDLDDEACYRTDIRPILYAHIKKRLQVRAARRHHVLRGSDWAKWKALQPREKVAS
jgi:hypothetical protein